MKMKILAAAMLSMMVSGVSSADTDTDSQDVTVTVPEVALLDVNDAAGGAASFACTVAGDAAGTNFTCAPTNATGTYEITANRSASGSGASRKITAELGANLDSTWDFQIATTAAGAGANGGAGVAATSVNGTTAVEVVTGINNVVANDGAMTYTLAPADTAQAMAYSGDGTTADTITVTYTLGDDA